jgi:hypothetical protein
MISSSLSAIPASATSPGDAQLFQCLISKVDLSAPSIDNYKLRQRFPFGNHTRVATINHLFHRGKVIGPNHALDIEMTVLFFAWNAISEDHTGCNGIRALDIGVVEALDMERELIQTSDLF